MSGVREAKREDELRWKKELETYRGRLNQLQMEVGKKEAEIDELRFENKSLKTEVAEIKKDGDDEPRVVQGQPQANPDGARAPLTQRTCSRPRERRAA